MNHGSLFSGIGGFDLAAEWMGWENIFHCEINAFCKKILTHHFKESISYGDITKTDFSIHRGSIDMLTGGDPCQPHSKSGKQKGTSDPRYLWPEMLRAIREIKPRFILNENVRGSISNGVLDKKIFELGVEGYTCWPPLLVPIGAGEAISERYRIYLVAYSNENANGNNAGEIRCQTSPKQSKKQGENGEWVRPEPGPILTEQNWETVASSICGTNDGVPNRLDRNGAIGNAVDPRIIFEIFKSIQLSA